MKNWAAYLLSGTVFGFGLALSGMTKPEVVLSFLHLEDLGLALVLGVGVLVTLLGFWLVPRMRRRACDGSKFSLRKQKVDGNLIVGSTLFGVGWGISGLCPGAAIASIGTGNWPILYAFVGMFAGVYLYGLVTHYFFNDVY